MVVKSIKYIVFFLISLCCALLFIEIYFQKAEIYPMSTVRYDTILGLALYPNKKLVDFEEGFYLGKINAIGYLGPDYPIKKSPEKIRIALLGDSYVQGHQVFDRHHFRTLLEDTLNAIFNNKVEVLNFGRGGFVVHDSYCYYKNFVTTFNPDVILFIIGPNDFGTNMTNVMLPSCELSGDSIKIKYDFNSTTAFKNRLHGEFYRGKSVMLRLITKCKEIKNTGLLFPVLLGKLYFHATSGENKQVAPFKLSEKHRIILRTMGKDPRIVFVLRDTLPQDAINEIKETHAPIIDCSGALNKLIQEGIDPYYWKVSRKRGHLNHLGHRVFTAEIVKELCVILNNKSN